MRGTSESEIVPELAGLPFADLFTILPKNSVASGLETGLDAWLDAHPGVTHRVVVGDCTDLCAYSLALHLKHRANARDERRPVIVPADCVDTYDAPGHPADLFHPVFLHSMAQNGVRVVKRLA